LAQPVGRSERRGREEAQKARETKPAVEKFLAEAVLSNSIQELAVELYGWD
jgi:hypothetical protein